MNRRQEKLRNQYINTPMMILPENLELLVKAQDIEAALGGMMVYGKSLGVPNQQLGIIPVYNALVNKMSQADMYYDLTSYPQIRSRFRNVMSDDSFAAALFDFDTPGGVVEGLFDLVDEIYAARGTKPIYAIVNENAFSAGYAIASAADKIYMTRTAGVGSIGVITMHVDRSKLLEDIGLKVTTIFAGARKNDFSPYQPLSEKAKQTAQDSVNTTYDLVVNTVARNRGISAKAIRDTEAGVFEGEDAVKAGLADYVMSWDQAIEDIAAKNIKSKGVKRMSTQSKVSFKDELTALMTDVSADEVKSELAELGYVPAGSQPDEDKIKAEAVETAKKEMLKYVHDIAGYCQLAGMPQMVFPLIEKGVSAEDARKQILKIQSEQSDNVDIKSFTGAVSTGAKNPLIADAERRAQGK